MSDRPVSLLDGKFAYEWARILGGATPRGPQASHRATTSSRTPGQVNVGTVRARAFEHDPLHLCGCGQTQHRCSSCAAWICTAPGHSPHVCGSAW